MGDGIKIRLNEKTIRLDSPVCLRSLLEVECAEKIPDVVVVNGFPVASADWGGVLIRDGDVVVLISRGEMPSDNEFVSMLTARNSPALQGFFSDGTVGVAGLGGLGSHVATALARTGIGALVLVDFDVVEPSNLNRQCYDAADIGRYKVDALAERISRFNPFVQLNLHRLKLDETTVFPVFSDCDVVVEAFDSVEAKAMMVKSFSHPSFRSKFLVTASGLAGIGSPNEIRTRQLTRNVFLCGDLESAAGPGEGLMAPRVMVAAGHQATVVLRLLAGRI
ncbi:MAG: sulfur carrier protein ThiS adenylyltransferase ThiF [Acidobacteria bacterium]|nr:sulfur carrier protein ThiS adenylyltransferase ThiF [Acidobacteriota bacterium]